MLGWCPEVVWGVFAYVASLVDLVPLQVAVPLEPRGVGEDVFAHLQAKERRIGVHVDEDGGWLAPARSEALGHVTCGQEE